MYAHIQPTQSCNAVLVNHFQMYSHNFPLYSKYVILFESVAETINFKYCKYNAN